MYSFIISTNNNRSRVLPSVVWSWKGWRRVSVENASGFCNGNFKWPPKLCNSRWESLYLSFARIASSVRLFGLMASTFKKEEYLYMKRRLNYRFQYKVPGLEVFHHVKSNEASLQQPYHKGIISFSWTYLVSMLRYSATLILRPFLKSCSSHI